MNCKQNTRDFEQISYIFHTLYLGNVLYMSQKSSWRILFRMR